MPNENKDVIRVQGLEADLPSTLRAGMIGFASDTDRMAYKRLDNSVSKYWSDDTKQALLAVAQTFTKQNTFTGGVNVNSVARLKSTSYIEDTLQYTPEEIDTITDGVTVLGTTEATLIKITKADSDPASNTVGLQAGQNPGQLLIVMCSDQSGLQIDPTVPGSADIWLGPTCAYVELDPHESVAFIWQEGNDLDDAWVLLHNTGTLICS